METATDTEAQLYQLLQCVEEGTKESQEPQDSFQQVDTIRTAASQLYAEAVKTNDEKFSCCLLRQYLDVYQESVVNPDAVNNYCDEVLNLLTAQQDDGERDHSGITESILDDPLTYVTDKRTCQGSYEDCFIWELNGFAVHAPVQCPDGRKEQVVENVLRSDPLRNVDHFGFKPTVCEGISEINSLDADEITRRVFAPRAASFTPKIPSTAKATIPNILAENPRSAGSSNKHDSNKGSSSAGSFRTAKDELQIQNIKKYGNANPPGKTPLFAYGKKSLGGRRTLGSKFVCPVRNDGPEDSKRPLGSPASSCHSQEDSQDEEMDERLRHIDPKMIELIRSEIMDKFTPITWDDIAGLDYAKTIIKEAVVWPILRPDIFTGLRRPPRGILLFGPPGTGKTLIGKCIASDSKSTFFSISASSLTSKWIGDGEKMVRALFAVAAVHQPAVVFIDEIDSLLCQRSETEHESSRRLKTEFLIQLDGAATAEDERILIVGATNRPQELDEAARRRLVRRLYIPLPELAARVQILTRLLVNEKNSLSAAELHEIGLLSDGFSGADMKVLCHEASMGPIRSIPLDQLGQIGRDEVRPVSYGDFKTALGRVRASVSPSDLVQYEQWDRLYGSGASC